YRFENGTDGAAALVAVDSSGNGYDLTAVDGTPLFSADVPVSEVTLTEEANDLSIDFGREQNALLGTVGEGLSAVEFGDITVETWVNFRNPTGWQTMVSRIDSAGDGHNNRPQALFILLNSGIDNRFWAELTTLENQTLQIEGGPVVVPGKWYHVAAVGDTTEGTLRLYVNGEEVASTTGYTGMLQPAMKMPWSIGRTTYAGNTSDWMNGKVDEVRISNVALAPSQFLNEFTFRTHPEDAVARTGENVTFVAEFVSKAPVAPDLQWEVSTDNGVTWNAISGANSASYT